ncbi:Uncharacterised protein [Mycobacteroides abscessus subsp. abscessus]|nr:Uncharacterised protein [Mycobacteroides abscessus subsp. abscessus]
MRTSSASHIGRPWLLSRISVGSPGCVRHNRPSAMPKTCCSPWVSDSRTARASSAPSLAPPTWSSLSVSGSTGSHAVA